MITVGVSHLAGSRPKSPTPRVTTGRMYPSRSPLARTVSMMACSIASGVMGISSRMARAER